MYKPQLAPKLKQKLLPTLAFAAFAFGTVFLGGYSFLDRPSKDTPLTAPEIQERKQQFENHGPFTLTPELGLHY